MSVKRFKCGKCGCKTAEEVMINVTQSLTIEGIGEDGSPFYGSSSDEGGKVDRYQCHKCGEVIRDGKGRKIKSMKDLAVFIRGTVRGREEGK